MTKPESRAAVEPTRAFEYLLNAFEQASQHDEPATRGYAEKRRALFAHVTALRAQLAEANRVNDVWMEADDMLDYLDDWCSSSELVIARGGDPTCKRVDTEKSGERTRDRLWINTVDTFDFPAETFRDALRAAIKENGAIRAARVAPPAVPAREPVTDTGDATNE
jgi:hypothetical protein